MADRIPVETIAVRSDRRAGYEIRIARGAFRAGAAALADHPGRALLVTTPTVASLYGALVSNRLRGEGWKLDMLVLPLSENGKRIEAALEICREAAARGLGRDDCLIGLGGGVCTDLVTMAASLLRRGIPHIRIPTTLMGQVDAAIGIKGAVNFTGKNSLGCFHPPRTVIVDPDFLRSLPWPEIRSGLAEIVKIATVRDAGLFDALEADWRAFRPGAGEPAPAAVGDIVARA